MIWPYSGLFGLYDFENGKRWRRMNSYFQLILKSPNNYENLGFWTSGLCLAFKIFLAFYSIFLTFRCLEYSKSFKFELFWSNFAIKTVFAENFAAWISVYMCAWKLLIRFTGTFNHTSLRSKVALLSRENKANSLRQAALR